ncbi:hypothetical protein TrVE_jg3319 [Triparma verrucosa]|uniref:RNB domain-containing protein n=1 Tax=Triparma verrucosa TaxID=1606542 RepID=A0A9W7KTS8_9STRA|nr:hypothetical protein TrVE_jg3319 [Triparma verrucosa]
MQVGHLIPPTTALIIPYKLHCQLQKQTPNTPDLTKTVQSLKFQPIIISLTEEPPSHPSLVEIPDASPIPFLQSQNIPNLSLYLPPPPLPLTSPPIYASSPPPATLPPQTYKGTFRCSPTPSDSSIHQSSGYVNIRRSGEALRIHVSGPSNVNRAIEADLVLITLTGTYSPPPPPSSTSPEKTGVAADVTSGVTDDSDLKFEGKIISILERREFNKPICGSIYTPDVEDTYGTYIDGLLKPEDCCIFYPVNTKLPPVVIPYSSQFLDKRIEIILTSWPLNSPLPHGRYSRTLGVQGDRDVETEVLLKQYDIPTEEFTEEVLQCLPSSTYVIKPEPGRLDLRSLPILSIDPPGCKDIDDALHSSLLPNGNWSVGVHIADVTHYVEPGSELDLEASYRCTSTYLVTRRLDMLPGLLTTELCSLKPGVDRYAFSVIWEMTPEGEVVDVEFRKSIIHSIKGLTYQQAQELIDGDGGSVEGDAVKRLNKLAKIFRKRRIEAGALTLASPEVKFQLDETSLNPTDVQEYTLYEANALVEEFMLLANVTVGKRILRQYPSLGVLRRHPSPDIKMFGPLIKKAASRGFKIDPTDSKNLADSLDAAVDPSDPHFNKLLRILSTRCMSPAQYFCSGSKSPTDWHHFGLASPIYTHFTSPIRRYADVLVHRLLSASIGYSPLPSHLGSQGMIEELCEQMNRRHRNAQMAGRESVGLFTLSFFDGNEREEGASVLGVERGEESVRVRVMVQRYGIEGRVVIKEEVVEEEGEGIKWEGGGVKVFDRVRVRIKVKKERGGKSLVMEYLGPDEKAETKRKGSGGKGKGGGGKKVKK